MLAEKNRAQRKKLRDLAALAHERELANELGALEDDFRQWRERAVDAFGLCDRIHAFHQGAARRLFTAYVDGDRDFAVASAIVRGVLSESEAGPDVLSILSGHIAFLRDRSDEV